MYLCAFFWFCMVDSWNDDDVAFNRWFSTNTHTHTHSYEVKLIESHID